MKKKIIGGLAIVAIAAIGTLNIGLSNNNDDLSAISLANIEALASGEGTATPCGGPKTYGGCQSANQVNCKDLVGCQ